MNVTNLVRVSAACAVVCFAIFEDRVRAGTVAISRWDSAISEQAFRYDLAGSAFPSFDSVGFDIYHHIDYDVVTNTFYGLLRDSGSQARLVNWNPDGSLLSSVLLSGLNIDGTDGTSELAVGDGIVAISRWDSAISEQLFRYDLAGNSLSTFDSVGFDLYHDIDYDVASNTFYGLLRDSGSQSRLVNWNPDGSLASSVLLSGLNIDGTDGTAELAVGDGIVAISRWDSAISEQLFRYDLAGNALSPFDSVGFDIYHDIDYDVASDTFYGLLRDSGSQSRLVNWNPDGSLASSVLLSGLNITGTDTTSELAIGVPIPEPSSLMLAGLGLFALGIARPHRRRAKVEACSVAASRQTD